MSKMAVTIEAEDARIYRETLKWVRRRMIRAFEGTTDMSLRKTINKHGPVIDELLEELKLR